MQIFVKSENLIFFQSKESAQKEKFGYQTTSGDVAILVKKLGGNYEIKIDEQFCEKVEPVSM